MTGRLNKSNNILLTPKLSQQDTGFHWVQHLLVKQKPQKEGVGYQQILTQSLSQSKMFKRLS